MNAVKTIVYAGFLAVGGVISVLTIMDCIDKLTYAIDDEKIRKMDQQEENHMDAVEWVESVKSQVLNK